MSELLGAPKFQGFDDDGDPLTGGLLYTYIPGTTTDKATYSDAALTTANANPVVLDSRGEAIVYQSGPTKFVLKTAAGATIWTMDQIGGAPQTETNTYNVDASEADQGAAGNGRSLKDIIDLVGATKSATIRFSHSGVTDTTTYTVDTDETIPSNFTVVIERGAQISIASGDTLTFDSADQVVSPPGWDVFIGAGTVTFTNRGERVVDGGRSVHFTTATAVGTGAQTLSAAELVGGVIDDDPEGNATWTTDTAANIVAAIPNCRAGHTFQCLLHNDATNASSEVVTIAGGTGVTLHGETLTLTEGTNTTAILIFRVTNAAGGSEAVDCFILT